MNNSRQYSLYLISLLLLIPTWTTAIEVVLPTIQFEEDFPFYIEQIHGDPIAVKSMTIDYDMVFFTKINGEEGFVSRSNMTNLDEAKQRNSQRNQRIKEEQWERIELQNAPIRRRIIIENLFAARAVASDLIKISLKSPSTADFIIKRHVVQKDGTFLLFGEVDAQNGFGVMIRNRFRIEIQPTITCNDYYQYSCWHVNDGPVVE